MVMCVYVLKEKKFSYSTTSGENAVDSGYFPPTYTIIRGRS